MKKIAILTDSSCDIPQDLAEQYGIDILWMNMLTVGLGEAVVCYVLGVPLVKLLEKQPVVKKLRGL